VLPLCLPQWCFKKVLVCHGKALCYRV
jgi:hypothetical protein